MKERSILRSGGKVLPNNNLLFCMVHLRALAAVLLIFIASLLPLIAEEQVWSPAKEIPGPAQHPPELIKLAEEFRVILGWGKGVPDFAAVVQRQKEQLPIFRARLDSLDITNWSMHDKIDYLLLRSDMDDLEFDLYVWRQTSRMPNFYVDWAIRHVGRLLFGGRRPGDNPAVMPFTKERANAVLQALADTENILSQARKNLTEMAPGFADIALRHPGGWFYTEGGELKYIVENYQKWAELTAKHFPESEAKKLMPTAIKAAQSLLEFGKWLEQNRNKMTGKYYIGKAAIDWYFRNVMFIPYNCDQIKFMAEIERARAISYIQFELQKNRNLPKIDPAKTMKEYLAWDLETQLIIRRWYLENGQNILSDQDYQTPIRSEEGLFLVPFGLIAFPYEEKSGVHRILIEPVDHWRFKYSNMGWRTDPAALDPHEFWPGHTYAAKLHAHNACPIRRNHRDGAHSEGWCFYNEEILAALDFPFVRGPHAREFIFKNMLQRSERRLIGLPLLAGEITIEEALRLFQEHNPPLGSALGVTREETIEEIEGFITDTGILAHQCMVGKLQLFKLLADRKMQLKEKFNLKEFHDQFMKFGQIPISLLSWEILGLDDEVKTFWKPERLSSILATLSTKNEIKNN